MSAIPLDTSDRYPAKLADLYGQPVDHPALYVLKADVETSDDVRLAELEIEGLTGSAPIPLRDAGPLSGWAEVAESFGVAGIGANRVLIGAAGGDPLALVRRLGMVQEVWLDPSLAPLVPVQATFERLAGASGTERSSLTHVNRRKNEYLTHPFHKYKAKFFPRMARALANCTVPAGGSILDPFVGSGTLLVESSLMGVPSTGLDIDPLSACIAEAKVDALCLPTAAFSEAADTFVAALASRVDPSNLFSTGAADEPFHLPEFIGSKMPDHRATVEAEIAAAQAALAAVPHGEARQLLRIAISHAVATKVSLRWMGTGDNRFAMAVAKRPVLQILRTQLEKMHAGLEQRDALVEMGLINPAELADARVSIGDVRELPYDDASFAGIVTSPPYLPASSGRETYLRSRAPSLVALGLLSEEEILTRDQSMIGSILRSPNGQRTVLPDEVVDLVEWMKPQRARKPKALPTAVYFHDLIASLREMGRVLQPGGRVAMVVSTEHVFYDLISREIVRRINMPEIIEQLIAEPRNEVPLRLKRVVQIELPKMDYAARPASRGSYSESIVIASRT